MMFWPVLVLATLATIIASQAVISGVFSVTQQAVQLGFLPRMTIRRTSETQSGQIFVPTMNIVMLVGVLLLLAIFPTSSELAGAYGLAVTGAMLVDTVLAFFILRYLWRRSLALSLLIITPFLLIDLSFFGSNVLKIPDGAWVPLVVGALAVILMWTWERGTRLLAVKSQKESIPLLDLIKMIEEKMPQRAPGTAVFLTSDPEAAPVALLHNLKHNAVLHEKNIVASVRTIDRPRVAEDERITIEKLSEDFYRLIIRYGFMESPNLPKALGRSRQLGLKINIMSTSFFLGRRTIVPRPGHSMPIWQDWLYLFLMRNAANPTDFFNIPPGRVVEMGTQVTL